MPSIIARKSMLLRVSFYRGKIMDQQLSDVMQLFVLSAMISLIFKCLEPSIVAMAMAVVFTINRASLASEDTSSLNGGEASACERVSVRCRNCRHRSTSRRNAMSQWEFLNGLTSSRSRCRAHDSCRLYGTCRQRPCNSANCGDGVAGSTVTPPASRDLPYQRVREWLPRVSCSSCDFGNGIPDESLDWRPRRKRLSGRTEKRNNPRESSDARYPIPRFLCRHKNDSPHFRRGTKKCTPYIRYPNHQLPQRIINRTIMSGESNKTKTSNDGGPSTPSPITPLATTPFIVNVNNAAIMPRPGQPGALFFDNTNVTDFLHR